MPPVLSGGSRLEDHALAAPSHFFDYGQFASQFPQHREHSLYAAMTSLAEAAKAGGAEELYFCAKASGQIADQVRKLTEQQKGGGGGGAKTASKSSKSKRAAKKPKGKKEQEMFDDL